MSTYERVRTYEGFLAFVHPPSFLSFSIKSTILFGEYFSFSSLQISLEPLEKNVTD